MSKYIKEYWANALSLLKTEVTDISYKTWIHPIKPHSISGNVFYLLVDSTFQKDFIVNRFSDLIKNCINQANSVKYKITFIDSADALLNEPVEVSTPSFETTPDETSYTFLNSLLNSKYTFDTFVIGAGNRLAHAGAVAVSENPAHSYNPLFIYGGSGLGKTHLLHSVGHHILSQNPKTKVLYVSSELFANEFINSIKDRKTEEFRTKYRNIDVLMIDDIQFFAGKDSLQEEFFHTFNALHQADKQIVLSCDQLPKEIPTLEERLRSRFAWGLIADIQAPDLETRIAILKKKIETENLVVPEKVLFYIASNVSSNIRDLEGALNKLVAYCTLLNSEMTEECAEIVLNDMLHSNSKRTITCDIILNTVAKYFDIRNEEIVGKKRNKEFTTPRHIAMFLCRELTDFSLPHIGKIFSKDHTTIMHGIEKIGYEIAKNNETKKAIDEIKMNIIGK
ncbi:MAG: chromosomal replication initiator protein DnaA [Bacillota bacterium]